MVSTETDSSDLNNVCGLSLCLVLNEHLIYLLRYNTTCFLTQKRHTESKINNLKTLDGLSFIPGYFGSYLVTDMYDSDSERRNYFDKALSKAEL